MAVFPIIQCAIAHALRRLFLSCHYSLNLQPQITSCQGQLLKALHWQSGCVPRWKESFKHEAFIDPQRPLLFFEAQVSEKLFSQSSSNQHCQIFKTTALKRPNFRFNILSQLQFQNHNQTGLSNLLVLWSIFRKKFLLPFAYRSYIRLFKKNILMAPFWIQNEKRGPFTLLFWTSG